MGILRRESRAAAAAGGLYGSLAGAGRLPKQDGAQQPTTTQPGTSGGGKVTYIDPNGDAQKGTTEGTPEETPGEPQRTYLDELRDQYQKMYDDAVKANNDAAKAAAERRSRRRRRASASSETSTAVSTSSSTGITWNRCACCRRRWQREATAAA